jgi:hypothetical protein
MLQWSRVVTCCLGDCLAVGYKDWLVLQPRPPSSCCSLFAVYECMCVLIKLDYANSLISSTTLAIRAVLILEL